MILGERYIEDCLEKKYMNIIELYKNLLMLKNNNNVYDLTKEILYSGNPDFNDFLSEINLIKNAKCNIVFGIGGPLSLCQAFSQNNICYISDFKNYITDFYENINGNLYKDVDQFLEQILLIK